MDQHTEPTETANAIFPRILFGGVGFIFAAIGVTVIGFLWMTPFNEFHSPPLFFRVFGSLVASMFVLMGGGIGYAAVTGSLRSTGMKNGPRSSQAGYTCPRCGAALGAKADVSPLGDVKCPFCQQWFNIHRRTAP